MRLNIDPGDREGYAAYKAMLDEIGEDNMIAVYVDGERLRCPTMADDVKGEARHYDDAGNAWVVDAKGRVEIKTERKPNAQD